MAYRVTRPFADKVTGAEYHIGDSYDGEDNRLKELLYSQYPAIESVPDDYEFNKIATPEEPEKEEPEKEEPAQPKQTDVV